VAGGYLSINIQKYGCLEITSRGKTVLRDDAAFHFREISDTKPFRKRSTSSRKSEVAALSDLNAAAFSQLKILRLELAKERTVPAYVIFSDATLLDMISKRPTNREEMLEVNGVGPGKFKKYGDIFLAALT
jgi:ATP-dependent DNA helicase RecQ